jgi:hypothetical protein
MRHCSSHIRVCWEGWLQVELPKVCFELQRGRFWCWKVAWFIAYFPLFGKRSYTKLTLHQSSREQEASRLMSLNSECLVCILIIFYYPSSISSFLIIFIVSLKTPAPSISYFFLYIFYLSFRKPFAHFPNTI